MLELVVAESVQGAREAEGEVWCVDDVDVEQAAREQAAAARNRRRSLLDDSLDEAALAALTDAAALGMGGTRSGIVRGDLGPLPPGLGGGHFLGGLPRPSTATGKRKGSDGPPKPRDPNAPPRKKKRLAPASNSCLACTKGKHCAHTCGVRGKAAEAAEAAAAAAAAAVPEGGTAAAAGSSSGGQ